MVRIAGCLAFKLLQRGASTSQRLIQCRLTTGGENTFATSAKEKLKSSARAKLALFQRLRQLARADTRLAARARWTAIEPRAKPRQPLARSQVLQQQPQHPPATPLPLP